MGTQGPKEIFFEPPTVMKVYIVMKVAMKMQIECCPMSKCFAACRSTLTKEKVREIFEFNLAESRSPCTLQCVKRMGLDSLSDMA